MDEINLFKNLPTPTSLMDKDGRRIDTNLATERLFGRSRDEIIGAKVEELYAKGDKEEIKNAFEESKRTGFSACEVTARGDGTTFPRF
jgi:PAS fold.